MDLAEKLYLPVSDAEPCGPFIDDDDDLENEFIALETVCRGKQEQYLDSDNSIEAETADWRDAIARAESLTQKTKDVRVLVYVAKSYLNVHGLRGLAASISLLKSVLESFWDEVHPILDDAGDDNPWRIMCLSELGGEDLIHGLSRLKLVESRLAGAFSLRDVKLATGVITPVSEDETIPDPGLITGAFSEADSASVEADAAAVDTIIDGLSAIESLVGTNAGSCPPPKWQDLKQTLTAIKSVYQEYASALFSQEEVSEEDTEAQGGAEVAQKKVVVAVDAINSRADVIRALEKINEYYAKNEPSSPLPLLINRAKRLVPMDFMAILKDISPEGVSQAEVIAGISDEDDDY